MAHCDEYSKLISASLDGALSPAETEKLNAHLAQCPDCRALLEELSALHAALSDLPPVEVPSGLTERIMAAVAAEQVLPFAPPEQKKPSIRWQRWLASAAVLAVVLLGTWSWKPWENTMTKDAKPESAAQAAQQIVASDSSTALPEASEAVEAAPEGVLAYTTSGEAPDNAAAPAPTSQVLPTSGKSFAAKISGESQDAILPMSTDNDLPAAAPEETELIAPRMATRAMPENGIGDSGEETPALFSALPAETPEETAAPAVQSFMVTSMLTSNELTSSEAADPVEMTPREALERLLEEYPMPGCETWEYEEIEEGWQSPEWGTADGSTAWLAYGGPSEGEDQIVCFSFDTWVLSPDGELICAATFVIPADGREILIAGA